MNRLQKGHEVKIIILLALYHLEKKQGNRGPKKREVLGYIERSKFQRFYDDDRRRVGHGEPAWEKEIAGWKQKLRENGNVEFPERDYWLLSQKGHDVLAGVKRLFDKEILNTAENRDNFLDQCYRFNEISLKAIAMFPETDV